MSKSFCQKVRSAAGVAHAKVASPRHAEIHLAFVFQAVAADIPRDVATCDNCRDVANRIITWSLATFDHRALSQHAAITSTPEAKGVSHQGLALDAHHVVGG